MNLFFLFLQLALLDGITMGGGVGLSIGASHRIVTEHVSFAMPEVRLRDQHAQ